MNGEAADLATTAASTLVALLTTDAWQRAKREVAEFWRRLKRDHVPLVEAELAQARDQIERATDKEAVGQRLAAEWDSRLRRLIELDDGPPDRESPAAMELARLAAVLTALLGQATADTGARDAGAPATVIQRADASGHSTVIKVGGNARIRDW